MSNRWIFMTCLFFGMLTGLPRCLAQDSKEKHAEPLAVSVERTDVNSKKAHEQLIQKTKNGKIDVYFVGDSITRRWGATDYPHFLAHWQKCFLGWNAANFGWGGDTTHNILWRMQNGELEGISPKVFVLQAGTNNLPRVGDANEATVEEIVNSIDAIVELFQTKFPHADVILTGVFPRSQNPSLAPTIQIINSRLEQLAQKRGIRLLNINDKLATKEGVLFPGMSEDGLHFTEKSYQVWADALMPQFKELLGPPASTDEAPPPTGDPSAKTLPK